MAITARVVKYYEEANARDIKRQRICLTVGTFKFHLTRAEAKGLRGDLNRMKL